jgi:hypothetical protein
LQAGKANHSILRDFTIENVKLRKAWKVEGELAGNAQECRFENVAFKNVEILGQPMPTPADGGLNLVNTTNVTINGVAFTDVISSAPDPKPGLGASQGSSNRGGGTAVVSRAGPNLLRNPLFKEGLTNWVARDPKVIELVGAPDAQNGERVLRLSKRGGGVSLEQDVTDLLRECGPGNYTWSATVRGAGTSLPVKVTMVIEDEGGMQQHPAPDVEVSAAAWSKTERRTPLKWTNLKRAWLRVESNWGASGDFYVHECWLSQ